MSAIPPTLSRLCAARHWVFDLDGTLTVAVHDFDAMRSALGCPEGQPILEWLAQLPEEVHARKRAELDAMEAELCGEARPAAGARALLGHLRQAGCTLGVLTRNSRTNALRTLRAIGLLDAFETSDVLGRDEARAKPSADGLLALAERWQVDSPSLVMVGDFRFDLEAGRAAGALTIHARTHGDERCWPDQTDLLVGSLAELVSLLRP